MAKQDSVVYMLLLTFIMTMGAIADSDYDYDYNFRSLEQDQSFQATSTPAPTPAEPEPEPEALDDMLAELEPEPEALNDTEATNTIIRQQTEDNARALRRLAAVMENLVRETSTQRCSETTSRRQSQELAVAIQEGFNILTGVVVDLNTTLKHYRDDINKKAFPDSTGSGFEDNGPCPSPFNMVGDDCLYIETEHPRYFDSARQACIEMGAKLAEFTNMDHFIDAVTALDLNDLGEVYIGATDRQTEGRWQWLSGGAVNIRIPWSYGEPNNAGIEDCMGVGGNGYFNDFKCHFRRPYACIRKK